jgi:Ca2+-binding RTX toxin-like protein
LRSIEDVLTGTGDDVLVGDRHANRLDGGAGRNLIRGGRGDDQLSSPAPGSACGPGRDTVAVAINDELKPYVESETGDLHPATASRLTRPVPLDCERADLGYFATIRARVRLKGSQVEISVPRPSKGYTLIWELRRGWRRGGGLLGKVEAGETVRTVVVGLNARGRRCVSAAICRMALTIGVDTAIDDYATSVLPLVIRR